MDQATKLPLRQFQLEQRKHCLGERVGFNQTNDCCLCGPRLGLQARARSPDHVGHQCRRDCAGATNLLLQLAQVLLMVQIE
jgi:hypothetical protein